MSIRIGIDEGALIRSYLKKHGPHEIIPIRLQRTKRFSEVWEAKGFGWSAEVIGKSRFDGYANIRAVYGLDELQTHEIENILQKAREDCIRVNIAP